jgi:hypothetical protein
MLAAGLALVAGPAVVLAEALHSKQEALALAFPEGVAVEPVSVVLTDAQALRVKELSGLPVESRLFTHYRGTRDGVVVGFAAIESHVVRTEPEVFLVVLEPDGTVRKVVLLAFYEPPEYKPSERWLEQFAGKRLDTDGWRVGRDIHGISGSTLTAHGIRDGVRRVVALHAVVMSPAAGK